MSDFVKCEICTAAISGEKCIFAIYMREINGEKHYFCCENHANEYERQYRKRRDTTQEESV